MPGSAFITGAGSGIGRDLAMRLAKGGWRVTVADILQETSEKVVGEIQTAGGRAQAVCCDVVNASQQATAFEQHLRAYSTLEVVCLNAGISEKGSFLDQDNQNWQKTLDIDLTAALIGVRLAAAAMQRSCSKGVIMVTASAAAFFPLPYAPVYSAAKGGLVNFVRAFAEPLSRRDIRLLAFCPQFISTALAEGVAQIQDTLRGLKEEMLTVDRAGEAAQMLVEGDYKPGMLMFLHQSGRIFEWQPQKPNLKLLKDMPSTGVKRQHGKGPWADWATHQIPTSCQIVRVVRLSHEFRAATELHREKLPQQLQPGQVLVRRAWAGVNASDVNHSAGRYMSSTAEAQSKLPYGAGFEAVGVVAGVGPSVTDVCIGDAVAEMTFGGFADYAVLPARQALPIPHPGPEMVALLTSGLTASIGLQVAGRMTTKQTILVTAAAGGVGQFVVQLAKQAGNHVVATCGGAEKAELLKRLGADRVIDYHKDDLKAILRKEYPKGMDIIWESIGGDMFRTCLRALAQGGRLIVIGMMSQYSSGWKQEEVKGLPELLLARSACVTGFFLLHYTRLFREHLGRLGRLVTTGRLKVHLDGTRFRGLKSVADAVEHLHSGKSFGKVVVQLAEALPNAISSRV
ncbi:hypothetical protein WJX74_003860 [Apatococcus lobatus]|uniref:Enoyl reductase (ER) domain-containing protein n=1 Tax=Apatococcus lobatus TaxID=904363 RepID=A0AAW1QDI3_9CHLO